MAYAPARCRASLLGLLALDRRLASIVRSSREPMLAQLRLAWWREQLSQDPAMWPEGEPLLAALKDWRGDRGPLAGLPAGWEAMTGTAPLPADSFECLAQARAEAFAALAGPHYRVAALRMARNWALADIAARLSHPLEREAAMRLALAQDWRHETLPRDLRPLAVLHGLAARRIGMDRPDAEMSPVQFMAAVRIGLFGR